MTPFGHVAVAYLAGQSSKKMVIPAILIGGILPDIDFLFFPFPWFNQIHRGFSHSILFLGVFALFAGLVSSPGYRWHVALSLFFGGLLHLLSDACLDTNPSNGIGVAFFWPFSKECFSPFNLLQAMESQQLNWEQPFLYLRASLWITLLEIPLYLIAVGIYWRKK